MRDDPDGAVVDWIATNAVRLADKTATVDLFSGREQTYARMHERVGRVAGLLRARGVGPGDRVAVLSMNSTDLLDIQFACWRIGAIYLPLSFRLTPAELAVIVDDADPKLAFVDTTFAETANAVARETSVGHWIEMDGTGNDTPFECAVASAEPVLEMAPQFLGDVCLIMYSSGTTGRPKGVTLSHGNMVYGVDGGRAALQTSADMVGLTVMPMFHIAGLAGYSMSCLHLGATTAIMRAFDPGEMLRWIGDAALGVTHLFGVPAVFNTLKDHPDGPKTDFSRIRLALAGAESVPEALVRWWLERDLVVQEVYGMTETCGAACALPREDVPSKIGWAGKALDHMAIKVADAGGAEVPRGEAGEILMRGAMVTPGYWNRPDADREAFIDGWLRSGDVGRMDADGCLTIEDRVKDMYISGGENVYPAEVENVLYQLDQIVEVAVIGVSDSRWGETGCAVVVLRKDRSLSLAEIVSHCDGRLAKFKHPAHIAVVPELPRNGAGKVLKFELRATITERLELR